MVLQIKLQLLREALTLSMCYAEALASDPANPRNSILRFGEPQAQTPFVIHTHPIHEQVVRRFFDTAGVLLLNFSRQVVRIFYLCLEKSFGHRLKPSTGSFFNGWGSTLAFHLHMLQNEKRRDELVFSHFGGYGGSRTRVRKPLDMNFSVGS